MSVSETILADTHVYFKSIKINVRVVLNILNMLKRRAHRYRRQSLPKVSLPSSLVGLWLVFVVTIYQSFIKCDDGLQMSSSVPLEFAKPFSVDVDESDFGYTGFSLAGEDVHPLILTTSPLAVSETIEGTKKLGPRRRHRQRKGNNGIIN